MRRSPRCQMVIDHAKQSCGRLGNSHLTSSHLVLGVLTLHGGVGGTVLRRAGLSAELFEQYLSSKRIGSEETVEQEGGVFGKSAADALARAELEAAAFSHTILGVEHLVLALLAEERGDAADLFASVHIDRDKMRQTILHEMT